MSAALILKPAPDAALLLSHREQLDFLRERLASEEADLAQLRAQLKAFETRYLRQVGLLYAQLDDLEARIAEREVALYDSDAARQRARQARERAEETHAATLAEAADPEEFDPPPSLKLLFRDLAKRIHPDFARDPAEARHFTLLMARANQAYRRGDLDTLQRLLDDHRELHTAPSPGEEDAAELLRLIRQIAHATRDLARLTAERQALLSSELAGLYQDAEVAARDHRDLLAELAAGLHDQVADAQRRFDFIDRQITAHGK